MNVTGNITDETGNPPSYGNPPSPVILGIYVYDDSLFLPKPIAVGSTQQNGSFNIVVPLSGAVSQPNLRVEVIASGGRKVPTTPSTLVAPAAAAGTNFAIGVLAKDCAGWIATAGSAVTQGNLIIPYIDNEGAWAQVTSLITNASQSISICELMWSVPAYPSPPTGNPPPIVISFFDGTVPTGPRAVGAGDMSPEERISLAANIKPTLLVSVLINDWSLGSGEAVSAGISLIGDSVLTGAILLALGGILQGVADRFLNTESNVAQYFTAFNPGNKNIQAYPFEVNFFPLHAKMLLIDQQQGFLITSPLQQCYWDTQKHAIGEWRRGNNASSIHYPIHDISLSIQGPAVADLYNSGFNVFWQRATSPTISPTPVPAPVAQATPPDQIAAVQIVRTLGPGVFSQPSNGETGILEAYQRAISMAQRFIYLETQYFQSKSICKALIAALKANPNLEVIVVCNITPDFTGYPPIQDKAIAALTAKADELAPNHLDIFTVWTHEAAAPSPPSSLPDPGLPYPRICPTYIHAKVAIVDDAWATIGSANLDGTSLDDTDFPYHGAFGPLRENDVNCVFYNAVDGQPTSNVITNFRQQLWAEHLGVSPSSLSLPSSGPAGFLKLWQNTASAALTQLQNGPSTQMSGRILELPSNFTASGVGGGDPYIRSLLVLQTLQLKPTLENGNLNLVSKVPAFGFHQGAWLK